MQYLTFGLKDEDELAVSCSQGKGNKNSTHRWKAGKQEEEENFHFAIL